jgi:hypothetical protein
MFEEKVNPQAFETLGDFLFFGGCPISRLCLQFFEEELNDEIRRDPQRYPTHRSTMA